MPPAPSDAADRLSVALDHVARRGEAAGVERLCLGFDTLRLGLRVRTGSLLAELIDIFGRRDAVGTAPTAWLDIVEGPDPVLEACLPETAADDERVVSATPRHYGFWDPAHGGKLVFVDRQHRRGFVWHRSPETLPSWETARPFLHAFKGLAPFTGLTPLHAAAVAHGENGVLIAGRGGAGKTSLALACVEAGWRYVADDFLLLRGTPSLRAVNLYRSARIRADMFGHLQRTMAASFALSTDSGEVKGEVDLGRLSACTIGDAEIGAIVVPHRAGAARAGWSPMRRSVVLRELAATTLAMLPGDAQATYDAIARGIEGVPCYAFDPGPTLSDAPAALAALADSLGTGVPKAAEA
ncbi:hypothetical protein ASG52_21630 [Methylobacterium sp. Leaf456]|uniref:hypothetical protein n=1 Tax=Methylobacterium sp. Leaf456 TaxID=1736382 RepID=UPI0006FBD064|nr:hypothetical protein [Methylobacterium sp. Leaf456]KQT58463.1 hypothetical protein ASG52_21630 [Methylobacterium sp. Leaf456]